MKQPAEAPPAEWQERLDTHLTVAMEALVGCAVEDDDIQPVAVFVKPDGDDAKHVRVVGGRNNGQSG